jgi:hypothetical protein
VARRRAGKRVENVERLTAGEANVVRKIRSREASRCAVCHGELATIRAVCGSCRAAYHLDCAGRCATLGCASLPASPPPNVVAPSAPSRADEGLTAAQVGHAILEVLSFGAFFL